MKLKGYTEEIEIRDWDGFIKEFNKLSEDEKSGWIFRGQKDYKYGLETALERAIYMSRGIYKIKDEQEAKEEKQKALKNFPKQDGKTVSASDLENGMIWEFKRKYRQYKDEIPDDAFIELLALMKHYGAPTRLLDFTYSFFVAAYLALENAEVDCAVWAINSGLINKKGGNITKSLEDQEQFHKSYNSVFRDKIMSNKKPEPGVHVVNPHILNERLVLQQGVFLCPGDVCMPFEGNLLETLKALDATCKQNTRHPVIKYRIKHDLRNEILRKLYRTNINRASLFPGLGGLAESLKKVLLFPEHIAPYQKI